MAYPTNPIYKLVKDIDDQVSMVKTQKGANHMVIPFNEENTDYKEYLDWVAEGNTAEEAD